MLQPSVSPEEIPAEPLPKYHTKISGTNPRAQQKASNMDRECKSDVAVFNLFQTLTGNLG